jgi:hypothetical protein
MNEEGRADPSLYLLIGSATVELEAMNAYA